MIVWKRSRHCFLLDSVGSYCESVKRDLLRDTQLTRSCAYRSLVTVCLLLDRFGSRGSFTCWRLWSHPLLDLIVKVVWHELGSSIINTSSSKIKNNFIPSTSRFFVDWPTWTFFSWLQSGSSYDERQIDSDRIIDFELFSQGFRLSLSFNLLAAYSIRWVLLVRIPAWLMFFVW